MQDYILSPDGSVVYRLTASGTLGSKSINSSLISGYNISYDQTGSLSLTSYNAGINNKGSGGAQFQALYNYGSDLPAGDRLEWVQVITTNNAKGNAVSPYLDNEYVPGTPFYSYTVKNKDNSLPANELNFYDYSTRPAGNVQKVGGTLDWGASLYPVLVNDSTKTLTVENGLSWGWQAKSATVGSDVGTFSGAGPSGTTFSGTGTSNFNWGKGEASTLNYAPSSFTATVNQPFKIGTITYHNGTNTDDPDTVNLDLSFSLTNVPEKNFKISTPLTLINTDNTDDPIASADTVSLQNFGYAFHVEEGVTATADLYATLSTGLTGSPSGAVTDSLYSADDTLGTNPEYTLNIVGLKNASAGSFVTSLDINGTSGEQTAYAGQSVKPFSTASVTDSTANLRHTLTVSLSNAADGSLSNLGLGTYDPVKGVYTVSGTLDAVNASLAGLAFTPSDTAASSTSTTFTITDTDSNGSSTKNSITSVVNRGVAPPNDAVAIDAQVAYSQGTFTITGMASSGSGVKSVEISALVDGAVTDLGAATVDANGTFSFKDVIGAHTQSFITATETSNADGKAAAQASYSLTGGLPGSRGEQDRYTADGSAEAATDVFKANGSQRATLFQPEQTFASSFFDTFYNGGAPDTTFVFNPGFGRDVIAGFRVDGTDHDMLSFKGSDYGTDAASQLASVLNNSRDTAAGLVITDPTASSPGGGPGTHDTLLLKGITKQQLSANTGDIAFHA